MVCEIPPFDNKSISCSLKYSINIRIESACVLRRVELHNRELEEGQSPWSIRQTGVYNKLSATNPPLDHSLSLSEQSSSTFILIAPSQNFESQLSQCLDMCVADDRAIRPLNIYRLLVADSLSGWLDYMTWLEDELKDNVSIYRRSLMAFLSEEILWAN
jgi:hypothetical protein